MSCSDGAYADVGGMHMLNPVLRAVSAECVRACWIGLDKEAPRKERKESRRDRRVGKLGSRIAKLNAWEPVNERVRSRVEGET